MQYNINVGNGTGMEVRTNLNLAHQSLATNFFGATDPSLMSPVCAFPGSTWADTGNGLLKVRNADDSDWIVIGTIESDGTPKITSNGFTVNASDVVNTPSGTISATNVQSAINSLNVFPLRQPSTAYTANSVTLCQGLPSLAFLSCTTAGTTGSGDITIPSPVAVGDTIADGTVVWTITQGSLSSGGLYLRQPSTAVSVGDVSYSSLLPSWARLLCTTAGTTDSGDLSVTLPISEGDTITDGTVTWTVQNVTNTANKDLSNLTQTGQDSFLERDFTIIYPNGGTEANPANITNNTRYVLSNPFAGYHVECHAELLISGEWHTSVFAQDHGVNGFGYLCSQVDSGDIVLQTANHLVIATPPSIWGNTAGSLATDLSSAPCRVKVWKIGKVASA